MNTIVSMDKHQRDPQPADNLILWLPVFLSCGIGLYFSLDTEPSHWLGLIGLVVSIIVTVATWGMRYMPPWRWLVAFAVAFSLGLSLAQFKTNNIETVLLEKRIWNNTVRGTITSFERAGAGWRLVLGKASIEDQKGHYSFRLTVRQKKFVPHVGDQVVFKASLMPPSPPLVPGSYNFQRHAFFHEVSGYGYVTKIVDQKIVETPEEENWLETYRDWLTEKVYAVLQQPEAGIVTAMLNGQRAGIERKTTQILQQSGLQHVISISGLHVGIMAITIFYLTRMLMACSMTLALHYPIKKIAAGFALVSIIFYLLIVGSSPPTLRSVIMSGIALIAIMLDREPIQLRVVALSGLFILMIQPESVLDIGFQMSFAAVIGLVAFYQQSRNFWSHQTWQSSIIMKTGRALAITVVTSLIATIITAPLVLLYFQQIPLLSMLANLLATPPITFLIMPGTFLAYLFTPLPVLGTLAIKMMGFGVTMMMDIGTWVAHMPAAICRAPSLPLHAVILIMVGVLIFIVVKHRARMLGAIPVLLGLAIIPFYPQADFLIMSSRVILQPDPASDRLFYEGRLGGFEKTMMLQWTGKKKAVPFPCENDICDLAVKGKTVRLVRTVPALKQACDGKPDIILTNYYLDWRCKGALSIARRNLEKKGGHALYLEKQPRVETSTQRRLGQ